MSHHDTTCNRMRKDDLDVRRRRLLFRCWHRGTQEIDIILGSFATSSLSGFESAQLERFEALLDCADIDLFIAVAKFLSHFCHSANRIQRDSALLGTRLCDYYFLC